MSITYKVDKFRDEGSNKLVGLLCTHENKEVLIIDKEISLVDGTSDESYVQQAYEASKAEIDEWSAQFAVKGKTFDPSNNSLSDPS
tara:strand:- start:61 stop:318 length:258 start_codon:yes stop_codon:yes gene_type:complete